MVDPNNVQPKRIVIVGSGVTGLTAAHTICKYSDCHVTLIEAEDRLGGHAYTIDGPTGERIDIGFMVMNDLTYPNLIKLYNDIGATVEPSDMSFSVFDANHSWSFQSTWSWTLDNIFRPRLWQFIKAHGEFAARGLKFLQDESPRTTTSREFAAGLNQLFVDKWLVPFISAVWSTSHEGALDFPVQPLLKFMHHHMFLTLETVRWTTPQGRSESYVEKLVALCPQLNIRTSARAERIDNDSKELVLKNGERIPYDALILTCSAPQAAALQPPTSTKTWIEKFETNSSRIVCHTSSTGMPNIKSDWASWNVAGTPADGPQVTYWISRLQNLSNPSIFLTLNPSKEPEGVFFETNLAHPTMNQSAYEGQLEEAKYQGHQGVYFAGAWLRNGFHEDGAVTGLIAARRALGREDIPVEFPTLSGLHADPVVGSSRHVRLLPKDKAYSIDYDMHLHRFDTRCPPKAFNRRDHFGDTSVPLDTCVRRELASRLNYWPLGKIETVMNLRYMGLGFNPLTPYFAHDEEGTLKAVLIEVHNTPWNERSLYAMRVLPGNVLSPAVHPKIMHVSPFNAPPGTPTVGEYEFKIVGTSSIMVTLRTVETKDVVMTASWKADYTKTHNVQAGSWRTVGQIYYQAAALFASGMAMHSYNAQPPRSLFSPLLSATIVGFLAVANSFSQAGMYPTALLFMILGPLIAMHHRFHGSMIPFTFVAFFTLFICAFVTVPSTGFNSPLGIASVLAFITSIFSSTNAESLRLLSYGAFGLASAGVAQPLPLWLQASALYLVCLYLWTARSSTSNSVGQYAVAIHGVVASSFALSLISDSSTTLIEPFHGLLATHLLYSFIEPSSNWEFYLHAAIVALIALLHPWEPVLFSWPVLAFFLLLQFVVGTAWAVLSRSSGFLAWRDKLITRVMQIAIASATQNRLLIVQDVSKAPTPSEGQAILVVNKPFDFFEALAANGELGVGESFVRNEWELGPNTSLTQVLHTLAAANLQDNLVVLLLPYLSPTFYLRRAAFLLRFGDLDRTQSANSIAEHYDDGNAMFKAFLGEEMVYTSASWDGIPQDTPLREAQRHKVQRILSLTNAKQGEKLLDIGSGWGYLVHNARQAGIEATGLCNCRSMVAAARERYGEKLYSLQDYRDIPATYDHAAITAVEMIEAVPAAHYGDFAAACYRALKPGGRVVLQVIHAYAFNNPVARTRTPTPLGTFVTTHIFPGQQVPNLEFLHEAFNQHKFKRVFTETRSHDYAETLRLWAENLDEYRHALPPTVYRKYKYYLNWCEVGFGIEKLHLSRVVFEKPLEEKNF